MSEKVFLAGAGKALLNFPDETFPTARENYVGIHDLPHVRVLILEGEEKIVIYNIEIVNVFPDTRERIVNALVEITGVAPGNIWYHNCHVLSTPHAWKVDTSGSGHGPDGAPPRAFTRTAEQQRSVELVSDTIVQATTAAAAMAVANMQPAKVGSGKTICYANANRNLETTEGWWVSANDEGPIDHNVPILRLDRSDGSPLAVLFGFHAQPAVMDMVFMENGGRLVSGDIAGRATEFIEGEYPEAIAMYFTGAGGDGTPYLRGDFYLRGRGGRRLDRKFGNEAFLLVELLGDRIGQQVLMAMERIEADDASPVLKIEERDISLPALKREQGKPGRPEGAVRSAVFEQDGLCTIPVSAMQISDMGFFGLIPEICQTQALYIEQNSPFEVTMVSTFTNSGPKERGGGKYMGGKDYYDKVTFQALNTMFYKGAAEKAAEMAVSFLEEIKEVSK